MRKDLAFESKMMRLLRNRGRSGIKEYIKETY